MWAISYGSSTIAFDQIPRKILAKNSIHVYITVFWSIMQDLNVIDFNGKPHVDVFPAMYFQLELPLASYSSFEVSTNFHILITWTCHNKVPEPRARSVPSVYIMQIEHTPTGLHYYTHWGKAGKSAMQWNYGPHIRKWGTTFPGFIIARRTNFFAHI